MTQTAGGPPPPDGPLSSIGGLLTDAAVAALPGILQRVFPGGVQGMLDQLTQSGFGREVTSWLGRGENQPITTEDLRKVLKSNQALVIAEKLGIPQDQALAILAKILPEAVDKQSPDGTLQTPPAPPA